MDRDPDRIAWLALLIVDEAAERADVGPVAPTVGLRLALAYLCSIADGPTFALPSRRHVFDGFWHEATRAPGGGNPHSDLYARRSMVASCLQQIGRQCRFGANIFNEVRRRRLGEPAARERVAEALRLADDERARAKWRKRQGYFGRPYPGDPEPENDR